MSRIGKQPIEIPQGVTIKISSGLVSVSGSKGALDFEIRPEVIIKNENNQIVVKIKKEDKFSRSLHGLTRALIANMIKGVTEGYQKNLELVGTGYRVVQQGQDLQFSLGFSHPVEFKAPEGVILKVEGQNKVIVSGIDKQRVGQTAAEIRSLRPPEPYKGKGVRYEGEVVRKKAGKQAKTGE